MARGSRRTEFHSRGQSGVAGLAWCCKAASRSRRGAAPNELGTHCRTNASDPDGRARCLVGLRDRSLFTQRARARSHQRASGRGGVIRVAAARNPRRPACCAARHRQGARGACPATHAGGSRRFGRRDARRLESRVCEQERPRDPSCSPWRMRSTAIAASCEAPPERLEKRCSSS